MLVTTVFHIPHLRVVAAGNISGERYWLDPWRAVIYYDATADEADQLQHLHDALIDVWDERWKAMTSHPAIRARRRRLRLVPTQRDTSPAQTEPVEDELARWGWPVGRA